VNSDWDMVPHQRSQELSSPIVNCVVIIFRLKLCSHYEKMFAMVSRYLVSMIDACGPRVSQILT